MSIRNSIKHSAVLSRCAYGARKKLYALRLHRLRKNRVDTNKVLFYRSTGSYGDNPRAVAERLHADHPQLELVWAYSGRLDADSFPCYVRTVPFGSKEFLHELATAGAWVCSSTLPMGVTKKPGQLYIQTWHGDKPIKRFANDIATEGEGKNWHTSRMFPEREICDYYVTGSDAFIPIAKTALCYEGAFLKVGMPRNDCLVSPDGASCALVRETLGIAPDVGVLVYAPTFRDYEKAKSIVNSRIDLSEALDELERKSGQDWVCLVRAHGGDRLMGFGAREDETRLIDATKYPDMADLLMIADALITDYSSCAGDFAIRGKLVALYQEDIEEFTGKGRALYFDIAASPYFVAHDMGELKDLIRSVSAEEVRQNCEQILAFHQSYEYGHASEQVSSVIWQHLLKGQRSGNGV